MRKILMATVIILFCCSFVYAQGLKIREFQPIEGIKQISPEIEEETEGSWIEIELVDEEDEAISSESYEIVAPDGSTIGEGSLDENGEAHSSGIDPGNAEITYPDLDDEAWEKE